MNICIVAHWKVYYCRTKNLYYMPSTHWAYCSFLIERKHNLFLYCLINEIETPPIGFVEVLDRVKFYSMPKYDSYWQTYFKILIYIKGLKSILANEIDLLYVRNPDPLCWIPALYASSTTIVNYHYVGDSIEATWKGNSNFYVKLTKCLMYLPEYFLMILISILFTTNVLCNGSHLRNRLKKMGVKKAYAVVSSTIGKNEIEEPNFSLSVSSIKLLYVGYLRPSKGVLNLLKAFAIVLKEYPGLSLSIVGHGEERPELESFAKANFIQQSVRFLGHIDDKSELKKIYESHHLFCFASLSEGSPRVVIEAMAHALLVISTPVGSLPYCFEDKKDIIFTPDFSAEGVYSAIKCALELDWSTINTLRYRGFIKVKENYTKEAFLEKIFS